MFPRCLLGLKRFLFPGSMWVANDPWSCIFTSQLVAYGDNQSGRIGWHAFADNSCTGTVQIIMW